MPKKSAIENELEIMRQASALQDQVWNLHERLREIYDKASLSFMERTHTGPEGRKVLKKYKAARRKIIP